jgi:hypothetical protein
MQTLKNNWQWIFVFFVLCVCASLASNGCSNEAVPVHYTEVLGQAICARTEEAAVKYHRLHNPSGLDCYKYGGGDFIYAMAQPDQETGEQHCPFNAANNFISCTAQDQFMNCTTWIASGGGENEEPWLAFESFRCPMCNGSGSVPICVAF